MQIETSNALIEAILTLWQNRIGADYAGYRGHVFRMYNFCLALGECTEQEKRKLAIAACFHDIGLWSDHTLDYIPPSITQLNLYLTSQGLEDWQAELGLMIELHHKIRPVHDCSFPLVELFRKADLVDFSLGLVSFGLPRTYIKQVKNAIPNQGFHWFLIQGAKQWFSKHPFSPPPFMKW